MIRIYEATIKGLVLHVRLGVPVPICVSILNYL